MLYLLNDFGKIITLIKFMPVYLQPVLNVFENYKLTIVALSHSKAGQKSQSEDQHVHDFQIYFLLYNQQ